MYQKTLACCIIGCAALSLAACNTSASAGAPQRSAVASTVTATAAPLPHFIIGQPANVGGIWTITLTSATVASGGGSASPTAGNEYLVVALTFKNMSSQTQTLSTAYSFALTDSSGEQYDQAVVPGMGRLPDGDIAAGGQVDGQLVFAVPQNQHAYALTFQNNAALQGAVVWDITD